MTWPFQIITNITEYQYAQNKNLHQIHTILGRTGDKLVSLQMYVEQVPGSHVIAVDPTLKKQSH